MVERLAAGAGYLVRFFFLFVIAVARMIGPALVAYGVWLIYPPAALIVVGLALTALVALTYQPNGGR